MPRAADTHPLVHQMMIEGYRRMTPAEKLAKVAGLTNAARSLALARVRAQHPEAGSEEQVLRAASTWLDADLLEAATGWRG